MKKYYVMDMGGTFVKYAVMNEDCEILEQGKYPSEIDDQDLLLNSLDEHIRPYMGSFEGIAVSMPGRIDTAKGIVHVGGSFHFFHDTPFGQILEDRYRVPVTLANDGKCAAKAEAGSGALKDVASGAVMIIGTGIGGGIILDHEVLMGCQNAAGEFSYLVTDYERFPDQSFTDFSAFRSTWADYSSASSLLTDYALRKGIDPKDCDGFRFFEAYDSGDQDAADALERFGRFTASGIFTLQSILDLERVAIGGGISARKEVTETIARNLYARFDAPYIPFRKPEIVPCVFGNDANLIGALYFHLDR